MPSRPALARYKDFLILWKDAAPYIPFRKSGNEREVVGGEIFCGHGRARTEVVLRSFIMPTNHHADEPEKTNYRKYQDGNFVWFEAE